MKLPFVVFMAVFTVWIWVQIDKHGAITNHYPTPYISKTKCKSGMKRFKKQQGPDWAQLTKQSGHTFRCVNVPWNK